MKKICLEQLAQDALAVANQSYKIKMPAEVIISAIETNHLSDKWITHIRDFFTDNLPLGILNFCKYYNISINKLAFFYYKVLKPAKIRNIYLEGVFKYE